LHNTDIDPKEEDMEKFEGDWIAQAVPLLNATIFGAMYLAVGKHPTVMVFHAETGFMEVVEVPIQTAAQQRLAEMYLPSAATWVLLAGVRIYELYKVDHDRKDGAQPGCRISKSGCGVKGEDGLERWAFCSSL